MTVPFMFLKNFIIHAAVKVLLRLAKVIPEGKKKNCFFGIKPEKTEVCQPKVAGICRYTTIMHDSQQHRRRVGRFHPVIGHEGRVEV
jgi:hypothetical protein